MVYIYLLLFYNSFSLSEEKMRTGERLLKIFQNAEHEWVSGEKIGAELRISRAAVWKAVMNLRQEGYVIDAVPNKGYRLNNECDSLSEIGILKYLSPENRFLDIHVVPEAGSTNALLWEKANTGSPEGMVMIASMQTDGKGRMGRKFYSPADTGIYMSILLRPKIGKLENAFRLTVLAAVAACETFEAATGKPAKIKWVNDIYRDNKKVCGILTEGSISMETGNLDAVVLGIGINVYQPEDGFPPEIAETAGSVFDRKQNDGRNIIAAGFLNRFMSCYTCGDFDTYAAEYRRRSLVTGKEITVIKADGMRKAIAKEIDKNCCLAVQYEDGTTETLSAGEISISL